MFYLIFTFLFFLGLASIVIPYRATKIFLYFSLILPTSRAFASLSYVNGLMITDGFFFGLTVLLVIKIFQHHKIKASWFEILLVFFVALIYLIYFFFGVLQYSFDERMLRELRPFLLLIQVVVFTLHLRTQKFSFTDKEVMWLAVWAASSNVVWFTLSYLGVFAFEDPFYSENSNRYYDLSTFFSAIFIIHFATQYAYRLTVHKVLYVASILFSFISLVLSNSRFLILSVILAVVFYHSNKVTKTFKYAILSIIVVSVFLFISSKIGQERVIEGMKNFGFIDQLANRFSPATNEINDMSFVRHIIGNGLGFYFKIPWFEYRELDVYNVSLDSTYLTHYTKQGMLGVLFIIVMTAWLVKVRPLRFKLALILFWMSMYFVSASFYQLVTIGAVMYLAILHSDLIILRNNGG